MDWRGSRGLHTALVSHGIPPMSPPQAGFLRIDTACLQIVDNIGNWLNYIASLTLVETLAGGRGLLISAVLIVRFLPTFLLFPVAGVIADRFVCLLYAPCLLSSSSCLAKLHAKCCLELQGRASLTTVNSSRCMKCRFDRPKVMLCSAAVNIFVVLGLALIKRPSDIW